MCCTCSDKSTHCKKSLKTKEDKLSHSFHLGGFWETRLTCRALGHYSMPVMPGAYPHHPTNRLKIKGLRQTGAYM